MGTSLSVEGRTARVEAWLPAETVRTVYGAFEQATAPDPGLGL